MFWSLRGIKTWRYRVDSTLIDWGIIIGCGRSTKWLNTWAIILSSRLLITRYKYFDWSRSYSYLGQNWERSYRRWQCI